MTIRIVYPTVNYDFSEYIRIVVAISYIVQNKVFGFVVRLLRVL